MVNKQEAMEDNVKFWQFYFIYMSYFYKYFLEVAIKKLLARAA